MVMGVIVAYVKGKQLFVETRRVAMTRDLRNSIAEHLSGDWDAIEVLIVGSLCACLVNEHAPISSETSSGL